MEALRQLANAPSDVLLLLALFCWLVGVMLTHRDTFHF